jgi:hypothetical protein
MYISLQGMGMPITGRHIRGHAYGHDIKHSIYSPINHPTPNTLHITQNLFLYAFIPILYDLTQILFPYPHT